MHKNARLTPLGRERIVRQVASGQTLATFPRGRDLADEGYWMLELELELELMCVLDRDATTYSVKHTTGARKKIAAQSGKTQ